MLPAGSGPSIIFLRGADTVPSRMLLMHWRYETTTSHENAATCSDKKKAEHHRKGCCGALRPGLRSGKITQRTPQTTDGEPCGRAFGKAKLHNERPNYTAVFCWYFLGNFAVPDARPHASPMTIRIPEYPPLRHAQRKTNRDSKRKQARVRKSKPES